MPRKTEIVRWETYTRPAKDGRALVYVRAVERSTGRILLTRSSGGTTEAAARTTIETLSRIIDFKQLSTKKQTEKDAAEIERDRLSSLSIYEFVKWFWGDDSSYIIERIEAKRPLSASYLATSRTYLKTTIERFKPFKQTSVLEANYFIIEEFVRKLRQEGHGRDVVDRCIETIRRPLNWAMQRSLVTEPFKMAGFILPERAPRERGLLTDDEVNAFLSLPVASIWTSKDTKKTHISIQGRPRLPKGEKNEGPPILDIRQKAAVSLALFCGMRRGEIRGLRWGDVDFEHGIITVRHNYVKGEDKQPKAGSFGRLPIAVELETILLELRRAAKHIGLDKPDDFALMNPSSPSKPVSDVTILRAWQRSMEHIGISEGERKRRNLVLHGARHRFVTTLMDAGLSASETAKMSRHKQLSMLDRYGAHLQDETIEKARSALDVHRKEVEKE